jgi:hypothetical protein
MIDTMAISDAFSATSSVPTSVVSVDPISINSNAPTRKRWRDDEDNVCDYDHQDNDNYDDDPLLLPYVVSAAQPIVTVLQTEGAKRPQLKYDPDVPMTREQTRAWRRDQRRKRNRESAAACRKRQRDLISVLEGEVAEWKAKFDNALSKIKERDGEGAAMKLQAQIETMFVMPTRQKNRERSSCATPPPDAHFPDEIYSMSMVQSSNVISPYDHPQLISYPASSSYNHHELHFPVLDDHNVIAKANHWSGAAASPDEFKNTTTSRVEKRQHLNEIITRPAQSRLLLLSSRRRGFGGWQCRHQIEFHSFGIACHALTQ